MEELDTQNAPSVAGLAVEEQDQDNVLGSLAAKRRVVSTTKEVYLPVPGFEASPPYLFIKYKLVDGHRLTQIGDKVKREVKGQWDRQLAVALDTFIEACDGFFYAGEDGEKKPLKLNGEPITSFGEELATALQFLDELDTPPTARNVVMKLFGDNDAAVSKHNFILNRWMGDTSVDVSRVLLEGNL